MTEMTRQQRRKLRRDYLERGLTIRTKGLPPELADEEAIGVTLVLCEAIGNTADPARASTAAAVAADVLERTLGVVLRSYRLGCHKGCAWCCRVPVACSAPEVFRFADTLRKTAGADLPRLQADLQAAAAHRRPLTEPQLLALRVTCPLLLDGACYGYEGRPIACRSLVSTSSQACRDSMMDKPIPLVAPALSKGEIARTLLLAAVSWAGLPEHTYEMVEALAVALPDPRAEARWLAGEDVFGGVRVSARPPDGVRTQADLARAVRALGQ